MEAPTHDESDENVDEDLLRRFLAGNVTADEGQVVEARLNVSQAWRAAIERIDREQNWQMQILLQPLHLRNRPPSVN